MSLRKRICSATTRNLFLTVLGMSVMASVSAMETPGSQSQQDVLSLEEIVVLTPKPESVRKAERKEMERLRQELLKDFAENQLIEKRQNLQEQKRLPGEPSAINWGFDAARDKKAHQYSGGDTLPWRDVSAATFLTMSF